MKTIRCLFNPTLSPCLAFVVTWNATGILMPAIAAPPSGGGKKIGQKIEVEVSFYDDEFDGIQSDDGGVYVKTRENKVKAHIELGDGQLHLHTWDSRDRSMQMFFPEPAEDCFPLFEELAPYVHANLDSMGIDLLAMEPGDVAGDEETESVQLRITFPDLANNHWYLIYDAVVARTNEVTWEIMSVGVAQLLDPGGRQGPLDCGFVDMSFGITVRILE